MFLGLIAEAGAFCGTYLGGADASLTNATSRMVVVLRGVRTSLTMINDFQGDAADFAMLVPVPPDLSPEDVALVDPARVDLLDQYSIPRVVGYDGCWELGQREPLEPLREGPLWTWLGGLPACNDYELVAPSERDTSAYNVVQETFAVGEYGPGGGLAGHAASAMTLIVGLALAQEGAEAGAEAARADPGLRWAFAGGALACGSTSAATLVFGVPGACLVGVASAGGLTAGAVVLPWVPRELRADPALSAGYSDEVWLRQASFVAVGGTLGAVAGTALGLGAAAWTLHQLGY